LQGSDISDINYYALYKTLFIVSINKHKYNETKQVYRECDGYVNVKIGYCT